MKIGIITQPLHTNYGGLLQNYALQQVLIAMNHDVYTINKIIIIHTICDLYIIRNTSFLISPSENAGNPYWSSSCRPR